MNKAEWHRINKKQYHRFTGGVCDECGKICAMSEGCIHHNTYQHKGGIYNASWSELDREKKIRWVCHECHEEIHSTVSIDGLTEILNQNKLPSCKYCLNEIYTLEDIDVCDVCENGHNE